VRERREKPEQERTHSQIHVLSILPRKKMLTDLNFRFTLTLIFSYDIGYENDWKDAQTIRD
jgi:hypothetical protein